MITLVSSAYPSWTEMPRGRNTNSLTRRLPALNTGHGGVVKNGDIEAGWGYMKEAETNPHLLYESVCG